VKNKFRKIKAILILGILLVSVSSALVPTSSAGIIINLSSYARVTYDSKNFSGTPIVPGDEIRPIPFIITYGINSAGFFPKLANLFLSLFKGRQVNIGLELVEWSPWCTPTLTQGTLTTSVAAEEQTLNANINLRVHIDAPAFGSGFVKVRVTVPKLGMIEKYENEFTFEFDPAYVANIDIEFSQGKEIEISPYNATVIPIEITNLGNGITKVKTEIVNISEKWNVSISDVSDVMIEVGGTVQTSLTVISDHKFSEETIKLKFTPAFSEEETYAGEPFVTSIVFINDGSYKEEEDFDIDTNLLFLIIFVIILLIIFSLILKKRRK
jgi:hypothetical protein